MNGRRYWYEDLAWLLRDAPGRLGETSNLGGTIAALESGGPGASVGSSDEHHTAMLKRLPDATRHKDLTRIWRTLDPDQRLTLQCYYEPRVSYPTGVTPALDELAGVALAFPPCGDQRALLDACRRPLNPEAQGTIILAKDEAERRVADAHLAWDDARRAARAPRSTSPSTRKAEREERVTFFRREIGAVA